MCYTYSMNIFNKDKGTDVRKDGISGYFEDIEKMRFNEDKDEINLSSLISIS